MSQYNAQAQEVIDAFFQCHGDGHKLNEVKAYFVEHWQTKPMSILFKDCGDITHYYFEDCSVGEKAARECLQVLYKYNHFESVIEPIKEKTCPNQAQVREILRRIKIKRERESEGEGIEK